MSLSPDDPRWTAYLLDELSPAERKEFEHEMDADPAASGTLSDLERTLAVIREALAEPEPGTGALDPLRVEAVRRSGPLPHRQWWVPTAVAASLALGLGLGVFLLSTTRSPLQSELDLLAPSETAASSVANDEEGMESSQGGERVMNAPETFNVQRESLLTTAAEFLPEEDLDADVHVPGDTVKDDTSASLVNPPAMEAPGRRLRVPRGQAEERVTFGAAPAAPETTLAESKQKLRDDWGEEEAPEPTAPLVGGLVHPLSRQRETGKAEAPVSSSRPVTSGERFNRANETMADPQVESVRLDSMQEPDLKKRELDKETGGHDRRTQLRNELQDQAAGGAGWKDARPGPAPAAMPVPLLVSGLEEHREFDQQSVLVVSGNTVRLDVQLPDGSWTNRVTTVSESGSP